MISNTGSLLSKIQNFIEQIPFVRETQIEVVQARKGFVSLKLAPQPMLFNHFNTYQAGALFTLAEITGGALCGTFLDLSKNLILTKQAQIDFQQATSSEIFSEAILEEKIIQEALSNLETLKKINLSVEVYLKAKGGQILVHCNLFYYLRSRIPRSFISTSREGKQD